MIDHSEVGLGHITDLGPNGRIRYRQLLERLLQDVNSAGPRMTIAQLLSAWENRKNKAKNNLADYMTETRRTRNTPITAILSKQYDAINKLFKNFALPEFIHESFGFGYQSHSHSDKEERESKLAQSEKKLIANFMDKNLSHLDGIFIHVGTHDQKQLWTEFVGALRKDKKTTKSAEDLLTSWIDAVDRVREEARKNGADELSELNKFIFQMVQKSVRKKKENQGCPSSHNADKRHSKRDQDDSDFDCQIFGSPPERKYNRWPSSFKDLSNGASTSRYSDQISKAPITEYTVEQLENKMCNNCLDSASHKLHDGPCEITFFTTIVTLIRVEIQEYLLESLPYDIGTPYGDEQYVVAMGDKSIQKLQSAVDGIRDLTKIGEKLIANQNQAQETRCQLVKAVNRLAHAVENSFSHKIGEPLPDQEVASEENKENVCNEADEHTDIDETPDGNRDNS
ncbi:hypothetical protein QAD02_002869 [Eretmocerus hayati]|uniref:Uncharacterized protein n=1 Tax=Eretmocerus hayati TaxID=131215 RepID=A0ACC2NQ12_9HYME|nr:hypothetical protein QAD02_002869 [Eretmocerus hayati]